MSDTRLIGAHVSASGGIDKAVERAAAIGANCVQVFSGSPRSWGRSDLASFNVKKIDSKESELHVRPIVIHSLYLLNFASENEELAKKTIAAVTYDLTLDSMLNGGGVVVHLGSHQGRGWKETREHVVRRMAKVLEASPSGCHFLMENAAGQQGKIGDDLEELRWLLDELKDERMGWCMDTCHTFASGYFLGKDASKITEKAVGKNESIRSGSAAEVIGELQLWETLGCVHVNDSRDPFGSGRDRHENLGEGLIPETDLRYFLNLPELQQVPLILEVPGVDDKGPDAENIRRLQALVQ